MYDYYFISSSLCKILAIFVLSHPNPFRISIPPHIPSRLFYPEKKLKNPLVKATKKIATLEKIRKK
jgi:hypothetical protein